MENVNRIVAEGIAAIEAAQDFYALEQIKARYLGKTGELTGLLKLWVKCLLKSVKP